MSSVNKKYRSAARIDPCRTTASGETGSENTALCARQKALYCLVQEAGNAYIKQFDYEFYMPHFIEGSLDI